MSKRRHSSNRKRLQEEQPTGGSDRSQQRARMPVFVAWPTCACVFSNFEADPATSWKDSFVVSAKITEEEGEGLRTCEGRVMTDKLWAVLPVELQWEIWTWLPPQETFRQMEVCRAWHENCSDDRFWQAVHMRHDLFSIHSLVYCLQLPDPLFN
jgi:hypothetical protein